MGYSPDHKRMKPKTDKRNDAYLLWLRGQRCENEGHLCFGDIVPAHTPDPASNGTGTKTDDRLAMALCVGCHNLQHQKGWPWFAKVASAMQGYEWHWEQIRAESWERYNDR